MEEKTYTYQQAYEASLKYFDGDELAARVWATKYALKDSFGHLFELTRRMYECSSRTHALHLVLSSVH